MAKVPKKRSKPQGSRDDTGAEEILNALMKRNKAKGKGGVWHTPPSKDLLSSIKKSKAPKRSGRPEGTGRKPDGEYIAELRRIYLAEKGKDPKAGSPSAVVRNFILPKMTVEDRGNAQDASIIRRLVDAYYEAYGD